MFRALLRPSSGVRDYTDGYSMWPYTSAGRQPAGTAYQDNSLILTASHTQTITLLPRHIGYAIHALAAHSTR